MVIGTGQMAQGVHVRDTTEEQGKVMATTTQLPPGLPEEQNISALHQAGDEHVWMHASSWRALLGEAGKRILVEGRGCMVREQGCAAPALAPVRSGGCRCPV
jgi:hypothetical protein